MCEPANDAEEFGAVRAQSSGNIVNPGVAGWRVFFILLVVLVCCWLPLANQFSIRSVHEPCSGRVLGLPCDVFIHTRGTRDKSFHPRRDVLLESSCNLTIHIMERVIVSGIYLTNLKTVYSSLRTQIPARGCSMDMHSARHTRSNREWNDVPNLRVDYGRTSFQQPHANQAVARGGSLGGLQI